MNEKLSNQRSILFFFLTVLISATYACREFSPSNMDTTTPIQVIAHRGGAQLAPENTLSAIHKAIELEVDMIEIDVILSKDGEVIVIHDDTVDRTSDGEGVVKEMTLAELKMLDAGSWFDAKFAGERIPTLDETLEAIQGKCILLIEIKDGDEEYPGLEAKVVDAIKRYHAEDWVIVQSFNERSVLRVGEMSKDFPTFFLMGSSFSDFYDKLPASASNTTLPYTGVAIHHKAINADQVKKLHELGYQVLVWTVNSKEDIQQTIQYQVDGIITDRPDLVQELL